MGKSRVQDYFRVPLGMIFSVEVKSHNVTDDNNERIKHGHMELLCKDQRKISFIMTNLEECN